MRRSPLISIPPRGIEIGKVYVIVALGESLNAFVECPPEAQQILNDFRDIISDGLSNEIPLLRDILHSIIFVSRFNLPNLPQYIMNTIEHAKLRR